MNSNLPQGASTITNIQHILRNVVCKGKRVFQIEYTEFKLWQLKESQNHCIYINDFERDLSNDVLKIQNLGQDGI